jgi:hypothetical protein
MDGFTPTQHSDVESQIKVAPLDTTVDSGLNHTELSLTKLATLDTADGCVFGVSHLHHQLFVICRQSDTVLAYRDDRPFERLEDVHVSGLRDPWDVASCSTHSCLYVTDLEGGCIWRVTLTPKSSNQTAPWSKSMTERWLDNVDRPWTVSVTDDARVILVTGTGLVLVIAPDGTQLCTVPLPAHIHIPLHAIELPDRTYLITHGLLEAQCHQVCQLRLIADTGSSEVVRTFGGESNKQECLRLREPWYVAALGRETFCLADSRNARLVLLDRELRLQTVVETKSGWTSRRPWRISYVERLGLVVVGLYNGGTEIYSTQQRDS